MATKIKMARAWTAVNQRDGREVYRGTKETDAARAARSAAEDNAARSSLASEPGIVRRDGVEQYRYECDPSMGRMKACKVFASIGAAFGR